MKKLMVVAHPDDETIWGGRRITGDPRNTWHVICCTMPGDRERVARFGDALNVLGATGEILPIPDETRPMSLDEQSIVTGRVSDFLTENDITELVTHGPAGEYGHPRHKQLNQLITSTFNDVASVMWFSLSATDRIWPKGRHFRALEVYFGSIPYGLDSYRYLNSSVHSSSRWQTLISQLAWMRDTIFAKEKPREISKSDLTHVEVATYSTTIPAVSENKSPRSESKGGEIECRPGSLLESNPSLYYQYDDRRYLILEHLPSCKGDTLSVGCHEFNSFDFMAAGNPTRFVTTELDPGYKKFGSPFGHIIGDFLDLDSSTRFDDIILFGVLGIPSDPSVTSDQYTLYDRFDDVVNKVDDLLKPGGRVLFGPDISIDRRLKGEPDLIWEKRIQDTPKLKFGYETTFRMRTNTNAIFVLRKFRTL